MDVESLTKQLILQNMTPEQQKAVLESVRATLQEARGKQKQRVSENVGMVVDALKKIEADIRAKYDDLGNKITTRVNSIRDGRDGANGSDGRDGLDGRPGRDGAQGPAGPAGRDGVNGIDGVDGVSVTDAKIDFDGSLIISLSNGREINVGEVVAPDVAEKIRIVANGGGTSQTVIDALASLQTQINNLIPSQTGNAGKFLTTNGSILSWADVAGGLDYQGTWNASTNTPTLASSVGTNGYYYIVATAGSTNLNGITDWQIGDWLLFNGTVWQKLDQTNLVISVNGQTGAVVLTTTDIAEGTNQYYLDSRARSAISAGTGISYNSSTGVVTNSAPDQTVALTGGTGISTSGTYPNFTITNSAPDQTVALTGAGTTAVTGTYPNFTITSNDQYTGTVTSVTGTSPVVSSGGTTPAISLASGYGDTQNPYASKTANYVLASPNGAAGVPTFRAIVAADIPTLNQNTTGTASNVTGTVAVSNGGTGLTTLTSGRIPYGDGTSALGTSANLFWDSTNSYLGLGNTTPGYRLDISSADTSSGYGQRIRSNSTATKARLQFTDSAASQQNAYVEVGDTSYFAVGTVGTERLRINSAGAVGLGTTSPIRQLTVSFAGSPEIALQDTTQAADSRNWRVFTAGTSLIIGTLNDAGSAGSDMLLMDTSGNAKLAKAGGKILNTSGNPILQQTGSILQVQNVYHTSTTQLTSSGALHELTSSLRIAFTPVSASSTLYLECYGSFVSPQSNNLQYAAFYDVTNSAYVNLPPSSGSRRRIHWFNRTTSFDVNDAAFMYFCVPVSNSSTTARTYTVYHSTEGSVIQFLSSTLSSSAGATYPLVFRITEVAS